MLDKNKYCIDTIFDIATKKKKKKGKKDEDDKKVKTRKHEDIPPFDVKESKSKNYVIG